MALKEVDVKSLDINPFTSIGDDWMLVTAGDAASHNTMTASWGGLGVLWGAPVATCYIRQSRYTKEFVDGSDLFTLSFLDPAVWRRQLSYLGRVSGRDEDKIKAAGLTPVVVDGTTTFVEARLTLVCRKAYATYLGPEGFIAQPGTADDARWYQDHDYHTMYIGKIEHAYVAE